MKKYLLSIALIVIFFAFSIFIPDANAIGLGGYVNLSQGTMSGTSETDNSPDVDFDSDFSTFGLGFVLDTCVARDSLFNYRLQIGYEGINHSIEAENGYEDDLGLTGFAFTNDFGFGVLRRSFMRLWVGPELRFSYGAGEYDDRDYYDVYFMTFGIGPAVGANFHLGQAPISLAVKMSYLFEAYVGAGVYDGPYDYDDQVYTGSGSTIFFTFSVLFRLGDNY